MKIIRLVILALFVALFSIFAVAQQTPQLLKRTATKTDKFDFAAGGTVSISGAPLGSIKVVGGKTNEIEIVAEIELQAPTEADLARLAEVTGFLTEESNGRTGIITLGTHNKLGDKKLWKKFPKYLLQMPFRVDYVVTVPRYCDLEINGGKGDLSITDVEGSMRIAFVDTKAHIEVITGATNAIIERGTVDLILGARGWRGRAAEVMVASGDLNVRLPLNVSAEIDALVQRDGIIENSIPGLKQRDRKVPFTEKAIMAKAGVGGVPLKFTVGNGKITMDRLTLPL